MAAAHHSSPRIADICIELLRRSHAAALYSLVRLQQTSYKCNKWKEQRAMSKVRYTCYFEYIRLTCNADMVSAHQMLALTTATAVAKD